jgi:hypothetical protein
MPLLAKFLDYLAREVRHLTSVVLDAMGYGDRKIATRYLALREANPSKARSLLEQKISLAIIVGARLIIPGVCSICGRPTRSCVICIFLLSWKGIGNDLAASAFLKNFIL